MNIHDQRATKPRWMRAATRRASSASPERSDADLNPIPFQVAGGAMDQTFPKDGLVHGGARHCCPHSVWHGARRKWMNIHDQRATKPRWMRAATRRASSASPERSDADLNPIPFHVAGGAMDQTFLNSFHTARPLLGSTVIFTPAPLRVTTHKTLQRETGPICLVVFVKRKIPPAPVPILESHDFARHP